jgi:hypothetical protein
MRAVTATLYQNLGQPAPGQNATFGAGCVLTGIIVKVGKQTLTVDEQLTKITPGELTLEVIDATDAVWTFIQDTLATSQGLLPPWLQLSVGGVQKFIGLVDPARMVQHLAADIHSVEFGCQDWSAGLATIYLGSPTATPWTGGEDYTSGYQVLNGNNVYQCIVGGISSTTTPGPQGVISPITDGTCTWAYVPPTWQRPVPTAAANTSTGGQNGSSNDAMFMTMGIQDCNQCQVYFSDPCEWVYSGAVLTLDQPVWELSFDSLSNPPSHVITVGATWTDPHGQVWTYESLPHNNFGWVLTTPWSSPARDPLMALPNPLFPALTIVASAAAPTVKFQVSAGPTPTWGAVFNTTGPGVYLKVVSVTDQIPAYTMPGDVYAPYCSVILNGTPWTLPTPGGYPNFDGCWTANFSLFNATAQDLEYWTVMAPVNGGNLIPLNCVNGLVIGDSICIVDSDQSGSWTVAGVDPILCTVQTVETVTTLPMGAHIYWTPDSQAEMVQEDPIKLLHQICLPYNCDTTKFLAPQTPNNPMFGWLPLRPASQADLYAIGDIEPTLTGLRLMTGATWCSWQTGSAVPVPSYSWTGTPDLGWTGPVATAPETPHADWTCQLVAAPASLMPYELATPITGYSWGINPWYRLRNRAYSDIAYRREPNGWVEVNYQLVNGVYVQLLPNNTYQYEQGGTVYAVSSGVNFLLWSPYGANLAGPFPVYDYTTGPRRLIFNGSSVSVQAWTGAAWGGATGYTWPGSPYIQSAVPFVQPGYAAGTILAYAVTATIGGTVNGSGWQQATTAGDTLELWGLTGGLVASIAIPVNLQGGTLVTTPYATYLVGAFAIACVTVAAGVITLTTLYLVDEVTALFANTLTAISANEFLVFGRQDTGTGSSAVTTTQMLIISTSLSNTLDASVQWSEKIAEGVPSLIGCVRDPSKAGRVVGHYGGSLWQVDTQRPMCVDRWTPGGMTAIEAIEHICQVFSTIAVPDAAGTMHIISRANQDTPIPITVPQTKVNNTFNWADFYSIVRVTSQDSSCYYDAYGAQGGKLMEVANQPMIWSLSGAGGMAQAMVAWFGKLRGGSSQSWFYPDPTTAPPWEALPGFARVTVNGTGPWRVMSTVQDYIEGTCDSELLGD